jgi:signal transduction histidine kinase
MFILGLIFERSRERAMHQLQVALSELKASNDQLTALNKEKDEIMGIAAHDLKNPLTAVIGNAEMLMLARDPSKVGTYAQRISSAGARMLHLIKSLLDANALEQGSFTIKAEPCSLTDLVLESLDHNRTAAQTKETQLDFHSSETTEVRADRSASVQVLDNLVSNAIKYSPRRSVITVKIVSQPDHLVVEVLDQGPGISEADQKKLFQKFVRLTAQPTDGESSTGLGLSIVKRLAEQMGGSVACRSALGQGSTFLFRLPKWAYIQSMRPPSAPRAVAEKA